MSKLEDWFLRGGERPDPEEDEGVTASTVTCQNCGGENLADEEYCTHCGAPLVGRTSTAEYCGDDDSDAGDGATDESGGVSLAAGLASSPCYYNKRVEALAARLHRAFVAEDADGPMTPVCPFCGESLEGNEGDTACPHCGEAIEWPEDADGPTAPDDPPMKVFEVEVTRRQKAFVTVLADGPEAAKLKVEASLGVFGATNCLDWDTVESFTSACLCREA